MTGVHDAPIWVFMMHEIRTPAEKMEPSGSGALAVDRKRNRLVLLNPSGTWESPTNGKTWLLVAPNPLDPAVRPEMTYDEERGLVVLYTGDEYGTLPGGDIWEWDGATWSERTIANRPPYRATGAMAYAPKLGGVVMYGGSYYLTFGDTYQTLRRHDLWLYDGVSWTQLLDDGPEGGRLVYDRSRDVLELVGSGGSGLTVWDLDGNVWKEATPAEQPGDRDGFGATFDEVSEQTVVFGGAFVDDTWTWDAQQWTELDTASSPPELPWGSKGLSGCGMTYVEAWQRVVFVGSGSLWAWDGLRWRETRGAPELTNAALTYDSVRERLVLVGYRSTQSGIAPLETWEYDGEAWTHVPTLIAPQQRWDTCLVFDPQIGRSVLFGGAGVSQPGASGDEDVGSDTWVWDGAQWLKLAVPNAPPRRSGHGMTWDDASGRVVLFGGMGGELGGNLDDTWTFDGSTWTELVTETRPPASWGRLTYDDANRRVVLVGSDDDPKPEGRTWFLDATGWSKLTSMGQPEDDGGIAFDPVERQVVLFGFRTWVMISPDCFSGADCATGFCSDGVCCDSACGGENPSDALACSIEHGARKNGVCSPIAAPPTAGVESLEPTGGCRAGRASNSAASALVAILVALLGAWRRLRKSWHAAAGETQTLRGTPSAPFPSDRTP